MPLCRHDRPRLGILPGWSGIAGIIPDRYLTSVLTGIQSAARVKKCDLLLAWGLGRVDDSSGESPAWPVIAPDSDFVPIGPWNTDGLIVFSPLRHEKRSEYLQSLAAQGFPVLYIASGENGPTISVDNEGGIDQAVEHLIQHGHRNIAFVAGDPADRGDSEARLQGYYGSLKKHGLIIHPGRVAHGQHTFSGGYEAIRTILNSGTPFTAVLASDDNSAIGAMKALQEAGLKIPEDVAVIGFDDQPDAVAQVPPLASIHVPLSMIGEQALALMFDHVVNQYDLESLKIPTRLIARQSCGCMPRSVVTAGSEGQVFINSQRADDTETNAWDVRMQKIVAEMIAALPSQSLFPFGERTRHLCMGLVQDFAISLQKHNASDFQAGLMRLLQELESLDENSDLWQGVISVLRLNLSCFPVDWQDPKTQRLAEDLLHQARTAISESAQRQDDRHQYRWEIATQGLSQLTARLSASLDTRRAIEILDNGLSEIGILHAHVVLFEANQDDPVAWSLLPHTSLETMDHRFATREFPPESLYPEDQLLNLALVPLVFQEELLGYIAFEASNLGPCAVIARQLAATLKASRLHAEVSALSLTDSLTGISNRRYFDLFLHNEVDRSRRFGHSLGLMIIDIDYFKSYNDSFGHPAGDKALQFVVRCLQQERRSSDVTARVGGEEFALILPETELDGAIKVAERIRSAVANVSDLHRPLTLSIGISILPGAELDADLLVQQADRALYEAKGRGRNRVCFFQNNGSIQQKME